jgi:hypothetical protein
MKDNLPIILIEGLLVLGGALAFGGWQLRSIRRDQQKAAAERTASEAQRDDDAAAAGDDVQR